MDRDVSGQSKPGHPEPLPVLDDSTVPNGCVPLRRHPLLPREEPDCDTERVGVLDYMPLSRHATPTDAPHSLRSNEPKNIELTTFRITECRDRRGLVPCSSCGSDDDELLGAETDDYLHEVVVQSSNEVGPERSGRAISGVGRTSPGNREGSLLLRCIPSSYGATRDGAWSRPDAGCESPPVDGEAVGRDLEEETFTTFRVASYESGSVAATTGDERDVEAVEGRFSRAVYVY